MREIEDTTESDGYCDFSGETGDSDVIAQWDTEFIEDARTSKQRNFKIIKVANSKISIIDYLQNTLKVRFEITDSPSGWGYKTHCPFKDHQDNSPSFLCNSIENIFHCWGCSRIGGIVQFISVFNNKPQVEVAEEILSKFGELDTAYDQLQDLPNEKIDEAILNFNNFVRIFLQKNFNNERAKNFIEKLLWNLDLLLEKHTVERTNINYENLEQRIYILKNKIDAFK